MGEEGVVGGQKVMGHFSGNEDERIRRMRETQKGKRWKKAHEGKTENGR